MHKGARDARLSYAFQVVMIYEKESVEVCVRDPWNACASAFHLCAARAQNYERLKHSPVIGTKESPRRFVRRTLLRLENLTHNFNTNCLLPIVIVVGGRSHVKTVLNSPIGKKKLKNETWKLLLEETRLWIWTSIYNKNIDDKTFFD